MKLNQIKPQVAAYYLKHPVTLEPILNDNGKEVFWHVVGQDSAEYHNSQQGFLRHLEKLGDKAKDLKPKDYRKQAVTQVASMVKGWDEEFNDFHDGAFSTKAVEKLLSSTDYGWMMNQLDSFIARRRNFFIE